MTSDTALFGWYKFCIDVSFNLIVIFNCMSVTVKNLENNAKKSPNDSSNSKTESQLDEMELDEYYIMKSFRSVTESLSLFKDDPLLHSPGKEYTSR